MMPKMWCNEVFEWTGQHYNIPPTQIVPKPIQLPHPPVFAAASRPELSIAIGELGLGALNLAIYHDEELAKGVRAYREAIKHAKPITETITNRFCCNPASLVLKDDKKAARYGLGGAQFFLRSIMNQYVTDTRPISPWHAPREFLSDKHVEAFMNARNTSGSQLSSVIGDPISARE